MSKMIMIGCLLGFSLALTQAGCEIKNCEKWAHCGPGDDDDGNDDEHEKCVAYCGRVSICGGQQADDFDDCVEACEARFEVLPERTAEIVACAESSSCEDVNEGRCSDPSSGGSGGSSSGGSSTQGGSHASGGSPASGGSTSQGGAPATGGVPATGGANANGGAPATGGASTGGAPSCTGGSASGGSDAGGASGEEEPCTCDCHCASGRCVDGYCAA